MNTLWGGKTFHLKILQHFATLPIESSFSKDNRCITEEDILKLLRFFPSFNKDPQISRGKTFQGIISNSALFKQMQYFNILYLKGTQDFQTG